MTDLCAFAGWMRQLSVYGVPAAAIKIQRGLAAVDEGGNSYRFERTRRDVRLADIDWYCASLQVVGRSVVTQNEHTVQLAVGDIGLVDGARPSTRFSENGSQWLSIYLPRQKLMSHLGFEPQACLYGRGGTLAARVLSTASETKNLQPRRPARTCGSPFTIYLAPYLRLPMRGPSLVMRIGCSPASAAS